MVKQGGDDKDGLKGLGGQIRGVGEAMMIPGLLVAGPLLGYFLGRWIGGFFDAEGAGGLVGLLLGLVAGIRETVRLIKGMDEK